MPRGLSASTLAGQRTPAQMQSMVSRRQVRRFIDHPVVEWVIFATGVLLLLISPIVGALPGPGGILVAGLGLAMVLKTSMWARRHYVRFKRWQPKAGRWTDWALRRRSALRREAMKKAEAEQLNRGGKTAGD